MSKRRKKTEPLRFISGVDKLLVDMDSNPSRDRNNQDKQATRTISRYNRSVKEMCDFDKQLKCVEFFDLGAIHTIALSFVNCVDKQGKVEYRHSTSHPQYCNLIKINFDGNKCQHKTKAECKASLKQFGLSKLMEKSKKI